MTIHAKPRSQRRRTKERAVYHVLTKQPEHRRNTDSRYKETVSLPYSSLTQAHSGPLQPRSSSPEFVDTFHA